MTALYLAVGGSAAASAIVIAATAGIHRLIDFHDHHTDRPSPQPIRPHRTPVAAITARPHFEACDELGPWNPSKHQPMPALLAGEPIGAAA